MRLWQLTGQLHVAVHDMSVPCRLGPIIDRHGFLGHVMAPFLFRHHPSVVTTQCEYRNSMPS
jgi:hypothetical protein